MGCTSSPEVNNETEYQRCFESVIHVGLNMLQIFKLSTEEIMCCSPYCFKVINIRRKSEKLSYTFKEKITSCCLLRQPEPRLVIGKKNGEIQIMHLVRKTIFPLLGHATKVTNIIRLVNGLICSASDDGDVFIWNLETKMDESSFSAHQASIILLYELSDGRLVTIGEDDSGKIFSLERENLDVTWYLFKGKSLIQLRDRRIAYNSNGDVYVTKISMLNDINEFDQDEVRERGFGAEIFIPDAHKGMINSIIENLDGQLITAGDDGVIKIWYIKHKYSCIMELEGHRREINVLFEMSKKILISAGSNGVLKLWGSNRNRQEIITVEEKENFEEGREEDEREDKEDEDEDE